jgi:hypothetical protein
MPRETAPGQYQQENEQRYRQQVDDELLQKHDRRSDLRLGRGKSLVIASESGLEFALALDDDGFITVTNYSTGEVGELTVRFDNVEGLAQEFIDIRAEFAAADGTLSTAYIAADAVVAADAASANATLSTTLTAAFEAADATVASDAAAAVASEATTRATADTAIASDVTALTARVTTAEGDINTVEATASAIDARLVTVEGSYATASSVSSLSATVSTKARTFSQTTAPTATATGDLWIDTDDNNKLYRWSGSAWVEITDPRIASSASTLTTVTADITSLETAVADLDATKAEASALTSLTATVSTVQSDLDTAEAAIVTNAAAITTESAARASGDSANATSITTLTAAVSSIRQQALPTRPAIATDFSAVAAGSVASIADLGAGTVVAVANEGDVRQFTAGSNFRHKGYLPVVSGRTYRVRGRVRTTVDGTDNRVQVGFRYLDSTYAGVGFDSGAVDNTFTVADGWLTLEYTRTGDEILTAAATSAYVTSRTAIGVNAGGTSSGATTQVSWVELEDITDFTTNAASITVTASAVADIEGRLAASYAIQVDGGGNGALVSLEDGTELGSVVKLAADLIELDAEAINLGSGTVFENTNNTIHTTASGYRYRDRGPFGASSDLLVWYGPTSVALNSETKTNGVFSVATDGIVRYGSAELLTVGGNNSRAKVLGPAALSFSDNSTWQEFATLDVSDVASGSYISMPFVDIVGQSQSAVTIGAGYQWRMTEAPTSSPTTKTVVKSGNFTVTAGSGGDPPTVDSIDQPSAQLVAVTNTGSVRYKLEIQRTSGTATIGLQATANFIINPG